MFTERVTSDHVDNEFTEFIVTFNELCFVCFRSETICRKHAYLAVPIIPNNADGPKCNQVIEAKIMCPIDEITKSYCVNCVGIEFQEDLSGCLREREEVNEIWAQLSPLSSSNRILGLIYQIQKFFIGFVIAFRPCLRSFQRHVWRSVPRNQEAQTHTHIQSSRKTHGGAEL